MTLPVPAPAVSLSIASLHWQGHSLIEDLRLSFGAGCWTCLLGASGVGKSTILRLLAGLVPPETVYHLSADDSVPLDRRVAYMAQTDLLLPWANVLENVLIGWRLRRQPIDAAARGQALELLAQVGLADHAQKAPRHLSGGMRQRVALARTLMENRPIVAMDEPFSALDAPSRHRLQDLAARLLAGRTVIMVTHDPQEAARLADEAILLHGRPVSLERHHLPARPGGTPRLIDDPLLGHWQSQLLARLADLDAAR